MINKMVKKVTVFAIAIAAFSILFLIGGNSITAKAATTDTQIVYMQNIYHDENDNVNVFFNVNENYLYDYVNYGYTGANVGKIIVKDLNTNIENEYNADKIQEENGIALYKAVFTHPAGHKILIEIEFLSPSMTGKQQVYYDDNNGHWYQCHSWN